jgi:hypothetical protein
LENALSPGIEFEIMWFDNNIIELRVGGSNGRFTGSVDLFVGHDSLEMVTGVLRGFPETAEDCREFILGTFDPELAGGGARFHWHCTDAVGRVAVDVTLRTDPRYLSNRSETAEFVVFVEPAAIDEFVDSVAYMPVAVGAIARLRAI